MMSILIAHNRYQQPGGGDAVVQVEKELLKENGGRSLIQYGYEKDEHW